MFSPDHFTDVTPTDGLYSLEQLYTSKDCKNKYWTPNRWLAQKRTKELFVAYGIEPSHMVQKELAWSYAMTINSCFAVYFYRKLSEISYPVLTPIETSL